MGQKAPTLSRKNVLLQILQSLVFELLAYDDEEEGANILKNKRSTLNAADSINHELLPYGHEVKGADSV
jgi:hypothetical protein